MSTQLHARLQNLASAFANSLVAAIRASSLEDLLAESGGRKGTSPGAKAAAPVVTKRMSSRKHTGRLARRSPEQIAATIDRVVALVKKHKAGLRAEQIRIQLGLMAKEMPRVLKEGLAAKKLTCKGQKRATTYFAK
jgi:hypothetical protein